MATILCAEVIDLDDRSLCFVRLWERGYRDEALKLCLDDARVMARIRMANADRNTEAEK